MSNKVKNLISKLRKIVDRANSMDYAPYGYGYPDITEGDFIELCTMLDAAEKEINGKT